FIWSNLCTRHSRQVNAARARDWPDKRRSVDLGRSPYDRLGIPSWADQRSELMSITIPKRVRFLDGVTDPLGGSTENLAGPRYGISQIEEIWNKNNWLPR